MTRLNQQTPREPTTGEMTYMQAQGAMMANPPFQVEEVNYVSNRGYTLWLNNNLPSHYHLGLRNHKNFSYGNQAIVPHASPIEHHYGTSRFPKSRRFELQLSREHKTSLFL